MGPAATYPITFNLTSVPPGVPVRGVVAEISLQHTFPDHLRMVLQSPTGTSVVLMANAGGDTNINVKLTFLDNAPVSLPDSTAIAGRFLQTHGLWFGHHSRASADERLFHDARRFRRRAGPRHVEALGVRRHGVRQRTR